MQFLSLPGPPSPWGFLQVLCSHVLLVLILDLHETVRCSFHSRLCAGDLQAIPQTRILRLDLHAVKTPDGLRPLQHLTLGPLLVLVEVLGAEW